MKNKFEIPELIIISFENDDIITRSQPGDIWNNYQGTDPFLDEEEF